MSSRQTSGKNRPGRQPSHGAHRLERLYREGALDGRTWEARRMQAHIDGLVAEHGGADALGYSDLLVIQRAAFRSTYCELIEAHCLRAWKAGKIPIDPGKEYDAKANGLRRDCESLRESVRQRRENGQGVPSLDEYLRARSNDHSATQPGSGVTAQEGAAAR